VTFKIESVDDLWNHIAYVLAYAPDRFPKEDFLAADQQMNLEMAFEQLREGVLVAYPEEGFATKRNYLFELLDRSYIAYGNGDELNAGQLLNECEDEIFKK
jgi:hypothetical protein